MDYRMINIKGYKVFISDCDYDQVIAHRWYVWGPDKSGKIYFCSHTPCPEHKTIYLHRLLMGFPKGLQVDHISGDTLDCRRENLRICTRAENLRNSRLRSDSTSGLKGAHWHKHNKKWMARIKFNGKHIFLGNFDTADAAHKAYCKAAIKYHGEFARFV